MNSPLDTDASAPARTGLENLTDALNVPDLVFRRRAVWDVLADAEPRAARDLAYGALKHLIQPRANLTPAAVERLDRTLVGTATDVIWAFQQASVNATQTLTALSRATPSPVHGTERLTLTSSILRPLIAAGYLVLPANERALTYAVADAIGRSLALVAPVRPVVIRLGARPVATEVADHDVDDWTGQRPTVSSELAAATAAAYDAVLAALEPASARVTAAA